MDLQQAIEIVWAATRQLAPIPGQEGKLQEIRAQIAALVLNGDPRNFPERATFDPHTDLADDYGSCEIEAGKASQRPVPAPGVPDPSTRHVAVLWFSADGKVPDSTTGDQFAWTKGLVPVATVGPVAVRGVPDRFVFCFVYDKPSGPQALMSGVTAAPMLLGANLLPAPAIADGQLSHHRAQVSRGRYVFGFALVVASLVLLLASAISIYYVARLTEAANAFRQLDAKCEDLSQPSADLNALWTETAMCGEPWHVARLNVRRILVAFDGAPDVLPTPAPGKPIVRPGSWSPRLSLLKNLVAIGVGAILLFMGAGYIVLGRWDGAFIDRRNRLSLSRVQMSMWTIVLLSGVITLGLWNGLLALPVLSNSAAVAHLMDLPGPFPAMSAELWATLGIALGSPLASALILKQKVSTQAPPANPAPPKPGVPPGQTKGGTVLDERNRAAAAGLADLILGEDATNRDRVDISRLQNLIITTGLVVSYASMLLDKAALRVDFAQAAQALSTTDAVWFFPEMPLVGSTFLGLLAASHATYLAAKYTNGSTSAEPPPQDGGT